MANWDGRHVSCALEQAARGAADNQQNVIIEATLHRQDRPFRPQAASGWQSDMACFGCWDAEQVAIYAVPALNTRFGAPP